MQHTIQTAKKKGQAEKLLYFINILYHAVMKMSRSALNIWEKTEAVLNYKKVPVTPSNIAE